MENRAQYHDNKMVASVLPHGLCTLCGDSGLTILNEVFVGVYEAFLVKQLSRAHIIPAHTSDAAFCCGFSIQCLGCYASSYRSPADDKLSRCSDDEKVR